MTKKKTVPIKKTPEHCSIYRIGKTYYCLFGEAHSIACYKAVRGKWTLIGSAETISGAKSLILEEAILERIDDVEPQKWIKARK